MYFVTVIEGNLMIRTILGMNYPGDAFYLRRGLSGCEKTGGEISEG